MNLPEDLAWIVLLLPLLAAAGIALFTLRNPRRAARLSITAVAVGFVLSLILFLALSGQAEAGSAASSMTWLNVGGLKVELGLHLDRLSLLMLLVVTGVGGVIHVYSQGYMRNDPGYARYFAGLSLFTFAMLGVVLANNLVMMFIFWELVGLSSYLLIGFWFERPSAADASKKAFLTNRVGDFGFLLGIMMVWAVVGTVNFQELKNQFDQVPDVLGGLATAAGLLIFCGAVGKSAQFPLHVWLPDAMEGPTPVSALIHAATMVAAGVYMLCRVFFLLDAGALHVIAWVGGFTALLAALMAVQQNDIKRILAYSTLSQLGYMVMAVGLQGPEAAIYHLTTHASFKALLFLGAGSVICALHHEQDIWRMGGLKRKMPVTYWTFLLATLALCGVPPFSGFFSKDEILAVASHRSVALFVLGILVAGLTTFYMFRLVFVAFLGAHRSEPAEHARESPPVMTWPMAVLALPAVLSGLWGLNGYLARHFHPGEVEATGGWVDRMFAALGQSPLAGMFGLAAVGFGFSLAWTFYGSAETDPLPHLAARFCRALRNRLYFDQLYEWLIRFTQENLARLADWTDRWLIAGFMVRGTHGTTEILGRALRLVQTGNVQTYAFLVVAGVVLLLYWTLGK
jgi:NADH-quinone oxidoreductase subunit L